MVVATDHVVVIDQSVDDGFFGRFDRGGEKRASAVTATVGYAGLAPSNFGAVLGYDAVSAAASSTSLARVAEFRPTIAR